MVLSKSMLMRSIQLSPRPPRPSRTDMRNPNEIAILKTIGLLFTARASGSVVESSNPWSVEGIPDGHANRIQEGVTYSTPRGSPVKHPCATGCSQNQQISSDWKEFLLGSVRAGLDGALRGPNSA